MKKSLINLIGIGMIGLSAIGCAGNRCRTLHQPAPEICAPAPAPLPEPKPAEDKKENAKTQAKPEPKPEIVSGPKLDIPVEPKPKSEKQLPYETPKSQTKPVQRTSDLVMDNSLTYAPNAPADGNLITKNSKKVSKLEITLFYPTRVLNSRKNIQMPIEACLGEVNPHALTCDNYAQFGSGVDNVPTSAGVFKKKSDEKGLLKQNDANWFYFQGDSEIPVRILTYEMERSE